VRIFSASNYTKYSKIRKKNQLDELRDRKILLTPKTVKPMTKI